MAGKRNRNDAADVVDLHGRTVEQVRVILQERWPRWSRLIAVRIIHGQGSILLPEVVRWCAEMGIPYLPDINNSGALRIFPLQRSLPNSHLGNTLKEKGLRLTAVEEAYLRDPATNERARHEERLQRVEQQRQRIAAAGLADRQRHDEALWQAEMARLGVHNRKRGGSADGDKPRPPVVIPALQLRFEEGYWKAELSRVAETDTETLQTQKKTGLDKLAPPMRDERPEPVSGGSGSARPTPRRDPEAERAEFEEEMARLGELDGFQIRRAKRE